MQSERLNSTSASSNLQLMKNQTEKDESKPRPKKNIPLPTFKRQLRKDEDNQVYKY